MAVVAFAAAVTAWSLAVYADAVRSAAPAEADAAVVSVQVGGGAATIPP